MRLRWLVAIVGGISLHAQSLTVSEREVSFGIQEIGSRGSSHQITLSNATSSDVSVTGVIVDGPAAGDFTPTSYCSSVLAPGHTCNLTVTFAPRGTGTRIGRLAVLGDGRMVESSELKGFGLVSCATISNCAYQELTQRATANRNAFYVYKDADSAFNHGYPSGLFGTIDLGTVVLDSSCIADPALSSGCSTDLTRLDTTRRTVFRFKYPALSGSNFVGLNWQDPENYNGQPTFGVGYNLTPATSVQFDVRSPNGANRNLAPIYESAATVCA